MTLVIASQLEPEFNDALAQLPFRPRVITIEPETPWLAAKEADILIVQPSAGWRSVRHTEVAPDVWPGRLRWVLSSSAGIDVYPLWLLAAPLVTCGRGAGSDEIADYVMAAIYLQTKDLEATRVRSPEAWRFIPTDQMSSKTIGLVGFGAIGQQVARRALAASARVVAVRRGVTGTHAYRAVEMMASVTDVVSQADHIVIAVPLTSQTDRMFDRRLLGRAKPGAHLINVARGSVVDQEALLDALDAGQIGFATLDVTDPEPLPAGHPLYTHPRVRLTPHISSNYRAVRQRLLDRVIEDIILFERGETPSNVVDPVRGY